MAVTETYAGQTASTFPVTRAPAPSYIVPEHDQALVGKVRRLFNDARTHRRQIVQKWQEHHTLLRNRARPTSWPAHIPFPEVPEIWPIVESLTGWLTDTRPVTNVAPASDPYDQYYHYFSTLADDLNLALQANWILNDHEAQVELVVRDAFSCGAGIFKTYWDNSRADGLGDALVRRVDPYSFYPDPNCTYLSSGGDTDGNYFVEARRVSLEELDRRFPGAALLLESGSHDEQLEQRPNVDTFQRAPLATPGPIAPATSAKYGLPGQGRNGYDYRKEGVTLLECWMRSHETKDNVTKDTWQVVCVAGPYVLLNKPATELWSHGTHPYDRYVFTETGDFWPPSMLELVASCQRMINRLLSAWQYNTDLVGNPVFLEDTRAGTQRTRISPRPGQRLTVSPGSEPKWLSPPTISTDTKELIQFYVNEMERISGLSAILRGMAPGGRNASSVIDSMQEASFVRVRMGSRNLERALRSSGEKTASLIVEYYTDPRFIAFLGPSGQRTARTLKSKHFYVPTGEDDNPSMPMRFSLIVHAGSMLPTSRQARVSEADTLFAMGAIDLATLLEAHDFPNREEVHQRVMQERGAGVEPPGARQRAQRSQ